MVMSHNRVRPALVLLVLAGAVALTGCDKRSDATKSLAAGSQKLRNIGVFPTSGTPKFDSQLKEVNTSVTSGTASGSETEKSIGSLMLAETLSGQAESQATAAKNAELTIRNHMTALSSLLSNWSRFRSSSEALAGFNPAKEIESLKASKTSKEAELAEHQANLAKAQSQQADLVKQAKAKMASAESAASEYASLSQSAAKLSATQAAEIIKNANVSRRKADDLRTEGGKLQAQADLLLPIINEYKLLSDKAQKQITNFDATVVAYQKRAEAAQAESRQAADAATVAANDIDKKVAEIFDLRAKALNPAIDSAIAQFGKAATSGKSGATAGQAVASVTEGSALLSVGEMHWTRAQSERALGAMLETLAATKPALPASSDYSKKAADAKEEAAKSVTAAVAALESAKSAFDKARITDKEVKERLNKFSEQITKLKDVASGAATVAAPAPVAAESAPAASGQQAAAQAPVDPALLAAADKFINAVRAGNGASIVEWSNITDADSKQVLAVVLGLNDAMIPVDKACRAKFQKSMVDVMSASPMLGASMKMMGGGMGDLSKLETLKVSDLEFTVNGDHASAKSAAFGQPASFVKKDGAWVVDLSEAAAMSAPLKPQLAMFGKLSDIFKTWGNDITAGKFADVNAAAMGLQAGMMKMMAPPPPGGG